MRSGPSPGLALPFAVLAAGALLAGTPAPDPSPPPVASSPEAPQVAAPDSTRAPASRPDSVAADPTVPGRAAVPWKIGEYFQFSIDWSGINGGNALMQVQNIQSVDGYPTYRVVTKAESNSFVSRFYKVRDRVETFMDAESLYSRRFEKHLREGGYKQDLLVRFDQESRRALYEGGTALEVPPRVHDVLSAFYYVRTRPLPDGGVLSIPTHDNRKSYDLEVKVRRRERVEVPAGKFDCVVVEPVLKSEGVFRSKGEILVWLTDDERRIPVLVKSKVPIGSISVSLTDMRLAFQGRR